MLKFCFVDELVSTVASKFSIIFPIQDTNVIRVPLYATHMKIYGMAILSLKYQPFQKIVARSQSHSLFSNENRRDDKRSHNQHKTYRHKSSQM